MVNSLEFKKDLNSEFSVESTCIYNPLNKKEILKKSKVKSRKIFKKSKFKIINVGRFVDQKDQLTLLKALNILKKEINFHAIFVGRGKLKFELLDYIKKNKLKNKVSIINFTKNPFPLIKQSDIFILSSNYEGLPNVLLEAAVLKKFIISSDCRTGPKEILLNGKGGLMFKVGNYKKLSKLIFDYYRNQNKYSKMINITYKSLDRFNYTTNLKNI